MNFTAVILTLFLTSCILSVFYWHVARETLDAFLRFRLFARRDKLRRLALDEEEQHSSYTYREVEDFICKTIAVVPSISLASFIIFMLRHPHVEESEETARFRREASPEL